MPLTQRVSFKNILTKTNLIQVPKLVRWQFKLEPSEILKITVAIKDRLGVKESFLGKMHKDGRITIPQLTLALLKQYEPNLEGLVLEITLEPT